MLFYKTNHRIQLRVAAIAIICGLLLSGASSYAVTDVSSAFALAPPLATNPPCEIVLNADGSFGVVTNTDVIELRGRGTVRSVRQDETLGKSFRNRWAFVDVGYLIARMLILTQEHKLQNPKDILIPLIKKHIRNRDGEAEILLEGLNIDGIEEMREGQAITGISLPVTRHGFPAYRLVYNLQSGETNIPMKGGTKVYVRVIKDIKDILRNLSYLRHDVTGPLTSFEWGFSFYQRNGYVTSQLQEASDFNKETMDVLEEMYALEKEPDRLEEFTTKLKAITTRSQTYFAYPRLKMIFEEAYDRFNEVDRTTQNREIFVEWMIGLLLYEKNVLSDYFPELRKPPKSVNLNALIDSVRPLKGDILRVAVREYTAGDIEIVTDEEGLTRALANIIVNASEAIAENKSKVGFRIRTQLTSDKKYVEIILADAAGGISPDILPHIFERGFTTKKYHGKGLGLAIVKDLVEARCGGTIDVQSELGKGTTFTIRLPVEFKFSKGGISRVIPSEISTVFNNSVIMFPAASKAWVGMGRELYNNYETARQLYDRAAMALAYRDVSRLFLRSEDRNVTEYFAICTVLYEVAMYTTLCENAGYDIKPLATIGNSVGEIASAIISGAVSLEDGLRTVQFMSRIFDEVSKDADYAFFRISGIDATAIRHLLSRGEIEIVQDASPVFISIAVKRGIDFEKLCAEFTKAGSKHIQIFDPPLYKAPHLSIYERLREILINFVATIEVRDPKFPIISIVTGKPLTTAEEVRKELEEQFFRPVLWKDGIRKALQMGTSSFVELGPGTVLTTLNKFLAPNVTSIAINEAYLSSVHHLQEVPTQRSTGWQRESLSNTFPSSECIHATNFQDTLAYIQAQPQSQPLIVALGTSWIKGYEKGRYLQYAALNPLIGSLRVYCESKGIPLIVDNDDKLLARINTERVKEGKTNAKVVVLAGENIVKSDEFAPLRNDEKNALVVGINNQELTTDSYIRLMEMLTLALRLSAGIEVSLDNAHITITKDNERHLYIFLPHAEPMDYEQLRQIYRVQEFA